MSEDGKPLPAAPDRSWKKPEHKKDWGPGWRYFACEGCSLTWREKTRDYTSPSGVSCRGGDCFEFCSPIGSEPHPEWPTDQSGNLTPSSEHDVWEKTPIDTPTKD